MDKRKVITAYRRGFITIQECAQILGIDSMTVMGLVKEPYAVELPGARSPRPVSAAIAPVSEKTAR